VGSNLIATVGGAQVQKLTDGFIDEINRMCEAKETELSSIS
jgi:ribosome recycling factor